jgi:hypothetical protein
MKPELSSIVATLSLAASALSFAPAASAEHVDAQTPYFSGVPLQSLVHDGASSSINTTQLVWGTSLSVHALALNGAGTLNVRLMDIAWPDALKSLTVLVTDLDGLWEKLDGAGSTQIAIGGAAQLFVAVFAKSEGKFLPGVYNLRADFAPVPLPAAAWLLLSGLGGLVFFRRRPADLAAIAA